MTIEQIRCSLVHYEGSKNPKFLYTRSDNTVLTNEEIDKIDIGQEEWPHQMPTGLKTWKFLDLTPDMRATEQKLSFIAAFRSIEKLTKLKFSHVDDPLDKSDITIEWKEDIETFDKKLGVLAHAYLYMPGSSKNGVMEFNDSKASNWQFSPLGKPNGRFATQPTLHIGMHEIGHLLGMRHDMIDQDAIMYPYAKKGYINGKVNKKAFIWQKSDVKRLENYFGKSNILPRWLRRWQARRVMQSIYDRK